MKDIEVIKDIKELLSVIDEDNKIWNKTNEEIDELLDNVK